MSRALFAHAPAVRRLVFRAMDLVANRLPMRFTRMVAILVGTLAWMLDERGRRVVSRNYAHLIPARCTEAHARAVRASYRNFAIALSEGLRLGRLPEAYLGGDRLSLIDPWRVFAHRPIPGPAILVTVHSNWELMLAAASRLRLIEQVEAITLSQGDATIDHLFDRKRAAVGCRSLLLDRAPLAALRALKGDRVLGILADRDYTGGGVVVRFAGAPMALPAGPAALSVQTGAPIIPMFLARNGPGRFMLLVAKPITSRPGAAKTAEVRALTERLARTMVRFISRRAVAMGRVPRRMAAQRWLSHLRAPSEGSNPGGSAAMRCSDARTAPAAQAARRRSSLSPPERWQDRIAIPGKGGTDGLSPSDATRSMFLCHWLTSTR